MKTCLPLLFLLVLSQLGFAQDYQPIRSDYVRFYDRGEFQSYDLYGLRIDSVVLDGTDSIYYNYLASRDYSNLIGWDCRFKRYSFIGSSVVVKGNGWSYFVNQYEDSVKLNHWASLNDTWQALQISPDSIVWATVDDVSTETILGVNDNVKTISLEMRTANDVLIFHPMNGKTIKLSETFGLVKSIDFYHFPEYIEEAFHDNISLTGAEELELGLRRPREESLFAEFEVGDEFAYRYWVNYHSPMVFVAEQYDTLVQIVDKQTQPQLEYTLAIHVHNRFFETDPILGPQYVHEYSSATATYTSHRFYPFYEDSICDLMPFEIFQFDYGGPSFNTDYDIEGDTVSFKVFSTAFGDLQPDGCIPDYFFEFLPWNVDYTENLGAVWGQTSNVYDDTSYQLMYLKRGNNIYGTPITASEILNAEERGELSFLLYPNPIRQGEQIRVQGNQSAQIDVFSISGQQIPVAFNNGTLQTQNLISGIYVVRFTSEKGVSTQKLVVTD